MKHGITKKLGGIEGLDYSMGEVAWLYLSNRTALRLWQEGEGGVFRIELYVERNSSGEFTEPPLVRLDIEGDEVCLRQVQNHTFRKVWKGW